MNKLIKTHYIGHNKLYKKYKTQGRPGWDTSEMIRENMATLEKTLQADYVPKKGKLLELGCGAGNITLWLAQKGYEVYGLDIAPAAIKWAREKASKENIKADFRLGNVLDFKGYPDDFFDFILDGHCFHCIIGRDRKLFLANAKRLLKPNGFFHVGTMCGQLTNVEMKKHFDVQSRCLIYQGIASRYIGLTDDILDEIRQAGFRILHWEIDTRKGQNDQDALLVDATKP